MVDGWRVFVGIWDDGDPDFTVADRWCLTWAEARDELVGRLRRFEGDSCRHCRGDAAEDLARLLDLTPGSPFRGEVEGYDYVIVGASASQLTVGV